MQANNNKISKEKKNFLVQTNHNRRISFSVHHSLHSIHCLSTQRQNEKYRKVSKSDFRWYLWLENYNSITHRYFELILFCSHVTCVLITVAKWLITCNQLLETQLLAFFSFSLLSLHWPLCCDLMHYNYFVGWLSMLTVETTLHFPVVFQHYPELESNIFCLNE